MAMALLFIVGYGAVTLCAILFMGIAMGTAHWIDTNVFCFGLFQKCSEGKCHEMDEFKEDVNGRWDLDGTIVRQARALCITAILLYAAGGLVMAHFVFLKKMKTESRLHGILTLSLYVLAGILAISAVIVYTKSSKELFSDGQMTFFYEEMSVGYSAYLAGTSGGLAFVGGILALLAVIFAVRRN